MRLKTEEFIEDSWGWIIGQDHNFENKEQFKEWAEESQPEVDAHAVNNYLTKIVADDPWSDKNAKIVNVHEEWQMNSVLSGSFKFKQEYEV